MEILPSNIKELELFEHEFSGEFLKNCSGKIEKLRLFNFDYLDGQKHNFYFPELFDLNVYMGVQGDDDRMENIVKNAPKLKSIDITFANHDFQNGLKPLFAHKALEIVNSRVEFWAGLESLGNSLLSLSAQHINTSIQKI